MTPAQMRIPLHNQIGCKWHKLASRSIVSAGKTVLFYRSTCSVCISDASGRNLEYVAHFTRVTMNSKAPAEKAAQDPDIVCKEPMIDCHGTPLSKMPRGESRSSGPSKKKAIVIGYVL